MTKGRTVNKYTRVYIDGYDLSGHARSIGPLTTTFQEGVDNPLNASITGVWLGQATISPGTLNSMFDNTQTTGIHDVLKTPGVRNVMVNLGIQAAPAVGDPAFVGQFLQDDYIATPEETPSAITVRFGSSKYGSTAINFSDPWGVVLGANTAWTAATTDDDVGIDQDAASALGGYMMYQVTAGDGTATILVEDSTSNNHADYGTLLTTPVLDCSSVQSGVVATATTATVKQFVRANIALSGASTVTFALAFIRNHI